MGITQRYNGKLSKALSHALRHEPWLFELELDEEGWVPVAQVVKVFRRASDDWGELSEHTIAEMIRTAAKQRHEMNKWNRFTQALPNM